MRWLLSRADYEHLALGAGEGDVEAAPIREEPTDVAARVAADHREDDARKVASLALIHRQHGNRRRRRRQVRQYGGELCPANAE